MKRSEVVFGVARVLSDALAVFLALGTAYTLRLHNIDLIPGLQILQPAQSLPPLDVFLRSFAFPMAGVFVAIAIPLKLYVIRITLPRVSEVGRIALATIVWMAVIVGWYSLVRRELLFSRALLLHATALTALYVGLGRVLLMGLQRFLLAYGVGRRRVLAVGTVPLPRQVELFLRRDPRFWYTGQFPSPHALHHEEGRQHIDLILQTDAGTGSTETARLIDYCRSHHIGYAFLPPVLLDVPHLLQITRFGGVPVIRFRVTPLDGWGAILKRTFDLVLATLLLLLLSPLLLLIALLTKFDSVGPILHRSKRVGQGGQRTIAILKFRSMVVDAEARKDELASLSHRQDGPLFKVRNDPRITRAGKLLRRWSLDELPQLLNVVVGQLSLVGPRPHLTEEVRQYTDYHRRVFAVKPGITGLAQVSGRSQLPFEEEVKLDLQYIEEWSPLLDLLIMIKTIGVAMKGKGAD